ncbi:MAG: hypothetical protein HY360_19065 [Verrucomicrobia bacterium]|nr:hypothetical protein [Verrucomicrobiota bacterium]
MRSLLAMFFACAVIATAVAETMFQDVLIEGVPHVKQKPDFCGEACVEMWARKLKKHIPQDAVFNASGVDPLLGRGCYAPELGKTLKQLGFNIGDGWLRIDPAQTEADLARCWRGLYADLAKGISSIVCMIPDENVESIGHFRLILGYKAASDEVVYHEPAESNGAYRRMKRDKFMKLWPLGNETVIRFRLEPRDVKDAPAFDGFTSADYCQRAMEERTRANGQKFFYVIQPPFVVIGDQGEEPVRFYADGTVRWAVDRLKQDYFKKDPAGVIAIWLFGNKESYEKNTRKLFGQAPTTPFGFYTGQSRALIMNIATGGGTLVHEIVHPFMASNFPGCPSWFNEGMGSLYEQAGERDGHIIGLTNWRLAGLQETIKNGKLPSFENLLKMNPHQFYEEDRGANYAQARYLCYYLQEKDLLVKYYRAFVEAREKDPSGYDTLKTILDEKDMDAFQKRWEEYVLGLRFP